MIQGPGDCSCSGGRHCLEAGAYVACGADWHALLRAGDLFRETVHNIGQLGEVAGLGECECACGERVCEYSLVSQPAFYIFRYILGSHPAS